jgi:acetyltransferase-like isoleucine patch superfamily enzyme
MNALTRRVKKYLSRSKGGPALPPSFDPGCRLLLSPTALAACKSGALALRFFNGSTTGQIRDFTCRIGARQGNIAVHVGNDGASLDIGEDCSGTWDFRLWRAARVRIGQATSCNGARLICDNSEISIGEDCMLSDEIILQGADQHGIVDLQSGEIINRAPTKIEIGNHVWIGRRANVLHGSRIGEGSIIGFGALVTSDIPARSLAVGVPARAIRSNVSWSRAIDSLDDYAARLVQGHRPAP